MYLWDMAYAVRQRLLRLHRAIILLKLKLRRVIFLYLLHGINILLLFPYLTAMALSQAPAVTQELLFPGY